MRFTASRPVMPWTMKVVFSSIRMDIRPPGLLQGGLCPPFNRAACGLVHRHGAVAVLHAVLLEDLEALLLPGARDAEDGDLLGRVVAQLEAGLDHAAGDDVHAGVGDDRHHHGDLVDARLLEHELRQAGGLADRRVAADLAVVRRAAAVGAHRVEERERAAAGADHEAEVAVELGDVAGHAAVVHRVDLLAGQLELGGLARLAGLLVAHAELLQQRLLARPGLVLHVHVRVERDERAVLELAQRVDLRERHVVVHEQLRQPGEDGGDARERAAGDARGGDHLLRHVVAERLDRGEVAAADLVRLLLGHLLDVDAADGREDHHRLLAEAVPDHAGVVLLLDVGLRVHEHAARHVAADLELQDLLRVLGRLVRAVGELHAARLHAAAGEHLGLDDGRAADPVRDLARLLIGGGEAEIRDRDARPLDDLPGLVLEEAHGGAEPYLPGAAPAAESGGLGEADVRQLRAGQGQPADVQHPDRGAPASRSGRGSRRRPGAASPATAGCRGATGDPSQFRIVVTHLEAASRCATRAPRPAGRSGCSPRSSSGA